MDYLSSFKPFSEEWKVAYEKYSKQDLEREKTAQAEAGKDVGRIVKYIMSIDKHRFYKIIDTEQRRYPVNVYALVKIDSE